MGSQMNLIAAVYYCVVAALAVRADRATKAAGRTSHRPSWMTIAGLFLGFALWRLVDGDHTLHYLLVQGHLGAPIYAERRWIQGLLVLFGGLCGLILLVNEARNPTRARWFRLGWTASLALLTLTGLRMISWHALDAILFAPLGPTRLNHVLDIGLATIVGWSAGKAMRRTGQMPRI